MAQNVKNYGVNEDVWCYGIYVDNEIEWGNAQIADQYYSVIDGVFRITSYNVCYTKLLRYR